MVERVRPRARDSRLTLATGIVALLLAIAVVKPWSIGTGSAPSRPPRPVAQATPSVPAPTPDATDDSPIGLAGPVCLGPGGWRVASLETWRTQDVRVWRAIEPVGEASGPLDPSIPSVPVVAVEIAALGWCAPAYGGETPVGPAEVTTWLVRDGVATDLPLRRVLPARAATPIAALYAPIEPCLEAQRCPPGPSPAAAEPGRWESGRVVFRYEDLGAGRVAWFAADVELIDLPAAPAPSTR